jgi:hypothetical protein
VGGMERDQLGQREGGEIVGVYHQERFTAVHKIPIRRDGPGAAEQHRLIGQSHRQTAARRDKFLDMPGQMVGVHEYAFHAGALTFAQPQLQQRHAVDRYQALGDGGCDGAQAGPQPRR